MYMTIQFCKEAVAYLKPIVKEEGNQWKSL